ncbi:unnamed protein product [Calypogeia fissa]
MEQEELEDPQEEKDGNVEVLEASSRSQTGMELEKPEDPQQEEEVQVLKSIIRFSKGMEQECQQGPTRGPTRRKSSRGRRRRWGLGGAEEHQPAPSQSSLSKCNANSGTRAPRRRVSRGEGNEHHHQNGLDQTNLNRRTHNKKKKMMIGKSSNSVKAAATASKGLSE